MPLGSRLRRRLVAGLMIGALFLALGGLAHLPLPAQAGSSPNIVQPPKCVTGIPGRTGCVPTLTYGHSYYITDPTKMSSLALQDASWYNKECVSTGQTFLTLLDFGRPGYVNGVYSVFNFENNGTWLSYTLVVGYSEQYAQDFYRYASSCPSLLLVIGTSNSYECFLNGVYSYACNVHTAGVQWDQGIHSVMTFVSTNGYSGRETVWGGDDMEPEWDQWYTCSGGPANPNTEDFANGFTQQEQTYSTHAYLADYGTADYDAGNQEGQCSWKAGSNGDADVYAASWGVGWDVPFPEVYHTTNPNDHKHGSYSLIEDWENVYNDYHASNYYEFWDAITECSEADPLPTGDCYVGGNTDCEYSPTEAYNTTAAYFNNAVPLTGMITNQQYQGAQQTGNGTC